MGRNKDTVMKMHKITHMHTVSAQKGRTFTINALCGYFEVYELVTGQRWDTPFIGTNDFTCEDCKAEYALQLLADLP